MDGFFGQDEVNTQIPRGGCPSCGLDTGTMLEPSGEGRLGIEVIAEGQGSEELKRKIQLIGKTSQRLRRTLREIGNKLNIPDGLDLDRDFRKTNSIACFPGQGVAPKSFQIDACRGRVMDEIRGFRPKVIISLGTPSVESLIGGRWKHDNDFSIGRWRGLAIPDHDLGSWLCPTFHPSYVERKSYEPVVDLIWRRDLERAINLASTPLPTRLEPMVHKLWTADEINKRLLTLWQAGKRALPNEPLILFFDLETTGKKPHSPQQRIKSCAVSDHPTRAYAWLWETMDSRGRALFRSLMEEEGIKKGGANNPFEHNWIRVKEGYEVKGWWWDVNVDGHILDNRPKNASVKFQVFSRLGVPDYDSHISPFLRAVGDDKSNGLNRIDSVDPDELLMYNGYDASFEFQVALLQRKEFSYA